MLIMAVVSHLLSGRQMNVPHIISIALVSMLIAAAFVITLILTIQRFYKNLLTDEGYLMFTLPVSTGRLIWSQADRSGGLEHRVRRFRVCGRRDHGDERGRFSKLYVHADPSGHPHVQSKRFCLRSSS